MEKQMYLVIIKTHDDFGDEKYAACLKENSPDLAISSQPHVWGLKKDDEVIAVIQPADVIADTTVWIDEEEQVFHQ